MNNQYSCLNKSFYGKTNSYTLVSLRYVDIFDIKNWRNDQISVLRQEIPLTNEGQENYYQSVILPTFQSARPPQILFSFLFNNSCIGYGGIVHLNWTSKRGELSFLSETSRSLDKNQYKQDLKAFLKLIKEIAFEELNLHRLHTETYAFRHDHINIMEEEGFVLEGKMRDHVFKNGQFFDSLIHGYLSNF